MVQLCADGRNRASDGHYADAGVKPEDYVDTFIGDYAFNGKTYALPYSRSTPLFYYNKAVWSAAGLPDRGPATWQEMDQWGPELQRVVGNGKLAHGWGNAVDYLGWTFEGPVWTFDGSYSDDFTLKFDDERTITAGNFLRDMVYTKKYAASRTILPNDFGAGILASTIASTGDLSTITKSAAFDFGTAFLPSTDGKPGCPTGGAGLAIPSKISDERKVNALKFIDFITNAANTSYFTQNTGYLPVRKSAVTDPSEVAYLAANPRSKTAVEQLAHTRSQDNARVFVPGGDQIIGTGLEKIATQNADVAATFADVSSQLQTIIDRQINAEAAEVMASVHFAGVSHRYPGADSVAVDNLELEIADGEFVVLVGPSGVRQVHEFAHAGGSRSSGERAHRYRWYRRHDATSRARDVAMVFQNYALYPNMTVADNMGFALRNAGMNKADTAVRVSEAAKMLELEDLLGRKPGKLSGGQRQRVAMGRAIVRQPKVFCMDEPLSNLDAKLRVSTRSQIASLQRRLGTTTVYVTHDQVEAMTMGDRVAVLKNGVLQQVAAPRELYDSPVNTFVAGFIGSPGMNLIDTTVRDGAAVVGGMRIAVPNGTTGSVTLGIRAEGWTLTGSSDPEALDAEVELLEELGAESFVYAKGMGDGWSAQSGRLVVRVDRKTRVFAGEKIRLKPIVDEVYFFSGDGATRL